MAPVVLLGLLQHLHTPLLDELTTGTIYSTKRTWRAFVVRYSPGKRTGVAHRDLGIKCGHAAVDHCLALLGLSRFDPISQVPIPHASRDNFFLINLNAGLIFWIIPMAC
ncbi:MAG: hypothetical protein R2867_06265 [Caldilineaceae bacterium]